MKTSRKNTGEKKIPLPMIDLVAKAQGKKLLRPLYPEKDGLYRYKNAFKSLSQLAKIGGMASSTLYSRFERGTYASIEEAVDDPPLQRNRNKKVKMPSMCV